MTRADPRLAPDSWRLPLLEAASPKGIRVWVWDDGTTCFTLRPPRRHRRLIAFAFVVLAAVVACVAVLAVAPLIAQAMIPLGGACATVMLSCVYARFLGPLEVQVTPAAVSWRRAWDDVDVCALLDIRSLTNAGAGIALEAFRSERVVLAADFGYDRETVSWIVMRMRQGIEMARSAGATSGTGHLQASRESTDRN